MHAPSVEEAREVCTPRGSLCSFQEAALLFGESGKNLEEPALASDGSREMVAGEVTLPVQSLIWKEEFTQELPQQEAKQLTESPVGLFLQVGLFLAVAIMGALVPQVTSYTKEQSRFDPNLGHRIDCSATNCKKEIPYHASVQVTLESLVSLLLGLGFTYALASGDKARAVRNAFRAERMAMSVPIAFFYAVGDLSQIFLIGATDGAFFLITSQLKLFGTAIVTKLVLAKDQTQVQWIILLTITLVCFLYSFTDNEKSSLVEISSFVTTDKTNMTKVTCDTQPCLAKPLKTRADATEVGMALAVLKTVLSALNAVLTERAFKAVPSEPIWVNQLQLKVCSVPFAVAFVLIKGMFFCGADKGFSKGACVQETGPFMGFGHKILIMVMCQAFQNFVVGLVYKKMNAVVKCLANAQSLWIGYFISVYILQDKTMEVELLLMVFLMVLLVIAYSLAKAAPAPSPAQQQQLLRPRSNGPVEMRQPMNAGA